MENSLDNNKNELWRNFSCAKIDVIFDLKVNEFSWKNDYRDISNFETPLNFSQEKDLTNATL